MNFINIIHPEKPNSDWFSLDSISSDPVKNIKMNNAGVVPCGRIGCPFYTIPALNIIIRFGSINLFDAFA